MHNFNDQKYIMKIINGNTKAFEVLVNQYKNMVYSIALKMMQNKEEAEEVAQDSFIKIFKSISKFKGDAKFSTWLYRITYNTCLDRIKKNKKFENNYPIDNVVNIQIDDDNAFDQLVQEDQQKLIKKRMSLLKKDEQLILTLYYYEELSLQEISEVLNKNYNQVRVNLYRSRKKLATLLNKSLIPELMGKSS